MTKKFIGVIAHDAGGAELVSSYIRKNLSFSQCQFSIHGPAVRIFEGKFDAIDNKPVSDVVSNAAWILCGTSWQSDVEYSALRLARSIGIKSISYLDHWVNYQKRFERNGIEILPDEIWLTDEYAKKNAEKEFAGKYVLLSTAGNPYLEEVEVQYRLLSSKLNINMAKKNGIRVLFVSEPVSESALKTYGNKNYWGYTEYEALNYFYSNRKFLKSDIVELMIRPHPAESKNKYNEMARNFDLQVSFGGEKSLLEEIVGSDIVIGCDSMALVIARIAKKRVISIIPDGGKFGAIPQEGIERLQDIIASSDLV